MHRWAPFKVNSKVRAPATAAWLAGTIGANAIHEHVNT
jgi:hypothetical protein